MLMAALVMLLAALMIPAWGYFTTYASARGGQVLHLGENTRIREDFDSWVKHLQVSNTDDNVTVFIRAKAFAGDTERLSYAGTGWTLNEADGYYYYGTAVEPGGITSVLDVTITPPEGAEDGHKFNVIVIYESVPAKYNAAGEPVADWTQDLTIVTEQGGN